MCVDPYDVHSSPYNWTVQESAVGSTLPRDPKQRVPAATENGTRPFPDGGLSP